MQPLSIGSCIASSSSRIERTLTYSSSLPVSGRTKVDCSRNERGKTHRRCLGGRDLDRRADPEAAASWRCRRPPFRPRSACRLGRRWLWKPASVPTTNCLGVKIKDIQEAEEGLLLRQDSIRRLWALCPCSSKPLALECADLQRILSSCLYVATWRPKPTSTSIPGNVYS
jgi:hypothetical protein